LNVSSQLQKFFQKRARGEKHTAFYSVPDEHLGKVLFQIPGVLIWSKLSASQMMGKLCFCFCFVLATSNLVDTVLGNKK